MSRSAGRPTRRRAASRAPRRAGRHRSPSSVASRPATSTSDAPAASSRAASIPCVTGITELSAWIHAGSWSSGTFAPETSSIEPAIMSAKRLTLRPSSPSAPRHSPSVVQANEVTTTATPMPPQLARLELDAEHQRTDRERDRRDDGAGHDRRQRTPEEEREPARRRGEHVRQRLRAALAGDRVPHAEHPRDGDGNERVADEEELVRFDTRRPAEVGEEQDLEHRERRP